MFPVLLPVSWPALSACCTLNFHVKTQYFCHGQNSNADLAGKIFIAFQIRCIPFHDKHIFLHYFFIFYQSEQVEKWHLPQRLSQRCAWMLALVFQPAINQSINGCLHWYFNQQSINQLINGCLHWYFNQQSINQLINGCLHWYFNQQSINQSINQWMLALVFQPAKNQ